LLIDGEKVPAAGGLGPLPPTPFLSWHPHTTWYALPGFGMRPCSHDGKFPSPDWPGWKATNSSQASWTLSSRSATA
jgi:hypothetical protein